MEKRFGGLFAKSGNPKEDKKAEKKPSIKPIKREKPASLIPVLKADKILSTKPRKRLLQELRLLIHAPSDYYLSFYQKLIENFAEFVQLLPHNQIQRYQREGGILDYALERAFHAVEIRKDYKFPLEGSPEEVQKKFAVWTYAVFSGSLLYNVGEAVGQYRVHLFDQSRTFTQQWQPYSGSMLNQGRYYKYWSVSAADARQYRTTTSLFARQLMPADGFSWIAEDPVLFNMFLALLNGDSDAAGILDLVFYKADHRLLEGEEVDLEGEVTFESILDWLADQEQFEELSEEDRKAGEEFLEWLIEKLEDGSLTVNDRDSMVRLIDGNLFMLNPEIFKMFAYSHSTFRDWTVIQKAFNMIGFAKLSGADYRFDQFFGGATTHHGASMPQQAASGFFERRQQQEAGATKAIAVDLTSVAPKVVQQVVQNVQQSAQAQQPQQPQIIMGIKVS